MSGRGALLVFEGCDRVGKSTQCKMLVEALNSLGRRCRHMHFPDRTTDIGGQLDQYLQKAKELPDQAIHLLFAANRWELVPEIKKTLESGTSIVVDRYAYSGVAYTAAKKIASFSWCKSPDVGIPRPDKVFYLEMPPQEAQNRAVYGEERYERVAFQEEVKTQYKKLKEREWLTLDAARDITSLHKDILQEALKVLDSSASLPIQGLWTEEYSVRKT